MVEHQNKIDADTYCRQKTNRESAKTPRLPRGGYWCPCDFALVGGWGKCPNCGSKDVRRRLKKEPLE